MEYVVDVHHLPGRGCRDSAQEASGCKIGFKLDVGGERADVSNGSIASF
jgi:hypothetical protein